MYFYEDLIFTLYLRYQLLYHWLNIVILREFQLYDTLIDYVETSITLPLDTRDID